MVNSFNDSVYQNGSEGLALICTVGQQFYFLQTFCSLGEGSNEILHLYHSLCAKKHRSSGLSLATSEADAERTKPVLERRSLCLKKNISLIFLMKCTYILYCARAYGMKKKAI
jgi:hypothetical protein